MAFEKFTDKYKSSSEREEDGSEAEGEEESKEEYEGDIEYEHSDVDEMLEVFEEKVRG